MKILIIVLCIVILLRDIKEGICCKKFSRAVKSVVKTPVVQAVVNFANTAASKTTSAATKLFNDAARLKKQIDDCNARQRDHDRVAAERSMWGEKIKNLKNQSTYSDPNFQGFSIYKYYNDEMTTLNNSIDKNTKLTYDLNKMLYRMELYQNRNLEIMDVIKSENTYLKECKMNQSITDNDYEVLK